MVHPDQIIVALDLEDREQAREIVTMLLPHGVAFKVGLQAYLQWGSSFVEDLVGRGARVFLDLKFHDIPNTVAGAVGAARTLNIWMVNLHTSAGMRAMRAARERLDSGSGPRPILIGVTVLTSMSPEDLQEIDLPDHPGEWAVTLAARARDAGLDGVVCSAEEVARIKAATASDFLAVTPGIRLPSSTGDDQRRVTTPSEAVAAGSDYLVVGRPIIRAENPVEGLMAILKA
ncbi:MAG TPA: orotidine-5'-phosphate decarboxylase [Thermoanaerobaculia bacterium]|nr:orotidine-5'-phosphate decarboxylase [Thermoanaerobaculia bacterium]HUM29665.1 orotidine-5'-phosphate decarboxylase [Thermoanaerobaculia bacterium]HXK67316.1 orotidine-5'-phosphate decarboxylase [Thermoanaerobaculia bacterium]